MDEARVLDADKTRTVRRVLSTNIDVIEWCEVLERLGKWATDPIGRYVCICNSHSLVSAVRDSTFKTVLDSADMATADGAPVAFMLRRLGNSHQPRINGPDLMYKLCAQMAKLGQSVFLLGGTDETLRKLAQVLESNFEGLSVSGYYSPPFRALTESEDADIVRMLNLSSANVVFVSFGCPKQEMWMSKNVGRVQSLMIGVGAAFDYHAGTISRAPLWMQNNGLEWLHRLCSEPKRLWRRYLVTNTLFIYYAVKQLVHGT